MGKALRVLLVEDSEDDAIFVIRELRRGGYEPHFSRVDTGPDMEAAIDGQGWDVVISDYNMPQFNALAALAVVRNSGLDVPFIIVSGKIGEDLAVTAMKAGANDYLMKGNLARLVPAIERELREAVGRSNQRKIEQAIHQGKREWEAAFDAVSDLIILSDIEGRVSRCNRRVVQHFNCSYQELIGKRITELFYGTTPPACNAFLFPENRCVGSEENDLDDFSFPNLPGWFNVACYPMHSVEEKLHGVVYIIKDITRRRLMEEEKRVSDRELLTLYAISFRLTSEHGVTKIIGDILFQLHNMLKIDFSMVHLLMEDGSLNLKAFLGISADFEAAINKLPKETAWVEQILAGKPITAHDMAGDFPAPIATAAAAMGMQSWCAVPLKTGAKVIGVLTVAHKEAKDFTDRQVFLLGSIGNQFAVLIENHLLYEQMKEKAAELEKSRKTLKKNLQEIKQANIELGRLNAAKNTFIGMASHELKTPLTSIMGGLQFLHQYGDLQMTEEQRSIFTSVYEGVVELKKLVEDLLSVSRIETQGVVPEKKPFNLTRLCQEVYETFALPLSKRQIRVEIDNDEVSVAVDEGLIKLAVRNLLENAIKFTPDGGVIGVAGRLVKRSEVLEDEELRPFYPNLPQGLSDAKTFYRLDITDTGIGIPLQERVRVFEKFYGVGDIAYHSSGKTDFMSKGSGLGLSIVKGIMDAHAGLVWNTSGADGSGTVFSLLFPLED